MRSSRGTRSPASTRRARRRTARAKQRQHERRSPSARSREGNHVSLTSSFFRDRLSAHGVATAAARAEEEEGETSRFPLRPFPRSSPEKQPMHKRQWAARRDRASQGHFPIKSGIVLDRHVGDIRAVDDVSLKINRGETVGLVGESGCGSRRSGARFCGSTSRRRTHPVEGRDISQLGENELDRCAGACRWSFRIRTRR